MSEELSDSDTKCNYPCERCFADTRPEYCGMCVTCGKWREEEKTITKRKKTTHRLGMSSMRVRKEAEQDG